MTDSGKSDRATSVLRTLIAIGVSVIAIRGLVFTKTFHSGLLYIGWPFLLSLMIYYFMPQADGTTWRGRFWNNVRLSMIVMFASSLILMEGYVCVIMFMPIFFVGVFLAFLSQYLKHRYGSGSINAHIIPVCVAFIALEGVTDATTFNRYNEVSYTRLVQSDVETIKRRLAKPPTPKGDRHWLISIFPMPKKIGTVRLGEGEVRTYQFEYHRWFATNTHRGDIRVTLEKVDDHHLTTTIEDTSYIANYMKLHGTELMLEPVGNAQTRVTLKIAFDRMIDPVWYFEPLQRFAVKKSAEYFITNLLSNEA
ncbi:MAG: hypothetical protein MPJ78_02095 [Hyphomicrobiaceae bacterium]|nr:hypothetical protein [Hyphomicrobiaceae bacterium]